MKELMRDSDLTTLGFYKSILDSEGIPAQIHNYHLGDSSLPLPDDSLPYLCVVNAMDYAKAFDVLRIRLEENKQHAEFNIACSSCGEENPGNFEVCWSCGEAITAGES